jgi:peptide/nickel transport system ATP-binding protein
VIKSLEVKNLTVSYGAKKILSGVDLCLNKGEVLAIVGESGSGKTMTGLAILGLLPRGMTVESGEILFGGKDVFLMSEPALRQFRGGAVSMVFQEPFTSLNPVMRVGEQIAETLLAHKKCLKHELKEKTGELFSAVKLGADVFYRYPHELSGGMRQRVMIAMALSCDPEVVILDEPTTALDVSIQKHVLDIILEIRRTRGLSMIFITHDLSIVSMLADNVIVMRNGSLVEKGGKDAILKAPASAYTRHLISCIPRIGDTRKRFPEEAE